ncbi:hypothetical protein H0H81_004713 [Sphagnurus paluster]|uniref:Uncharacterized protein n=1 Tax=Sphagnurus paluster TaxID=117069 RepID=A0A9P7FRI6_9AGAR|nr:hypothetical protein H0H81_004713 [Sphagnurus paluster]
MSAHIGFSGPSPVFVPETQFTPRSTVIPPDTRAAQAPADLVARLDDDDEEVVDPVLVKRTRGNHNGATTA